MTVEDRGNDLMKTTIEISDETKHAINALGGTFDTPDDVIQRLIQQAGKGDYLDPEVESGQDASKQLEQEPTASEWKDRFIQHLTSHTAIKSVEKISRSAWEVETESSIKVIWVHYYKDFDIEAPSDGFFGGRWNVHERLREDKSLIHVFMGPGENNHAAVPDEDFLSDKFTRSDESNDGESWKINTERGSNAGAISEYRGIGHIIND